MRRTNHSSRGVLPTVVRRCVLSRNLVNEEALAHWGLLRQKNSNKVACIKQFTFDMYFSIVDKQPKFI